MGSLAKFANADPEAIALSMGWSMTAPWIWMLGSVFCDFVAPLLLAKSDGLDSFLGGGGSMLYCLLVVFVVIFISMLELEEDAERVPCSRFEVPGIILN